MGGGSILDIGVYTLHLVDTILGPDKPVFIKSKGTLNCHGTDENMSAILEYPGGKIAVVSVHTKVEMDCSAYIHGTKGTIKVRNGNIVIGTFQTQSISDLKKKTLFMSYDNTMIYNNV